eukprot:6976936-Alexandrium_andersonii.AAC.1
MSRCHVRAGSMQTKKAELRGVVFGEMLPGAMPEVGMEWVVPESAMLGVVRLNMTTCPESMVLF